MSKTYHVCLRVMTEEQASVIPILEMLSRVAAGLSFEYGSVFVSLNIDKSVAVEVEED